ncbi:MAG: hypothetical protein QOH96_2549 [Blastocatellia bacterium]|jgi:hypothetical protein|nr:hypothetical protein [Blastocatellia bacterium]
MLRRSQDSDLPDFTLENDGISGKGLKGDPVLPHRIPFFFVLRFQLFPV